MSGNENAEVIRRAVAALNRGDMDDFAGTLADDIVLHVPGSNRLSGDYKGRDDILGRFFGTIMGLTGGRFTLESHDILGSADHAVGLYRYRAEREGRAIEWNHVNVYHFQGGKIAEVWWTPYDYEAWNAFWS